MNIIKLPANKDLYVRIPESLHKLGKLKIILPASCVDKTIRISVIDNTQAPFEDDAIYCDAKTCRLTYFGTKEYWEPEEYSEVVVEGNYNCQFSECSNDCHVVSCPVHQGIASSDPHEIKYTRSDKVK